MALTRNDIATRRLQEIGLNDLTSYSKKQKAEFWKSVTTEYLAQFSNKHT
mgnify:CR=1 FL=1